MVHHHAAIDQPTDVSNVLYISTSISLYYSLESAAFSVLFTSSLLSCSPQGKYAATPLIITSAENRIEVTRFLVEHGASVNYQNKVS